MRQEFRPPVLPTEISPLSGSEKQAAVALILSGADGQLLLIRRAEDPRDPWSGHMALPGGRWESQDENLLATAVRETQEEVGVRLTEKDYLGALPVIRARSRTKIDPMVVAPFVFRIEGEQPQTTPNYEVAEALWLPLFELTNPERKSEMSIAHEGKRFKMPAIRVGQHKIWGLTYGIISSLLTLLEPSAE